MTKPESIVVKNEPAPPQNTPGPWEVRYGNVSDADEGFGIVSKVEPGFGIVAECWPCTTDLAHRQKMRANARLIVSAPDLLEACKDTLVTLEEWGDGEGEAAQSLREVIAKAEAASA